MEHHHIFSLDKNEIGCTDTAEHIIELMDDELFKERFWRIAPPLLEEVRENLQDMLDGGVIWPSKSPWCNAIVLVRKKEGTGNGFPVIPNGPEILFTLEFPVFDLGHFFDLGLSLL